MGGKAMQSMNYVILDLEWNGSYSKRVRHYVNEIIEFGAVKVDSSMKVIDRFSMLVKPQIGKKLNGHIASLTHISNDELFGSDHTFKNTIAEFGKFSAGCVILTWGTSDILTLMDNFEYYTNSSRIPFLKYYCNLQEFCENRLQRHNPSAQMGLQTCADILDVQGDDNMHRAYSDALLSYKCLEKLYDPQALNELTVSADESFYKKITFKNKFITDINNPLIDKSQFFFNCEQCGIRTEQLTHFKVKSKGFIARFRCPKCRRQFTGKFTVRLKYEGAEVKKKIVPRESKPLQDDEN